MGFLSRITRQGPKSAFLTQITGSMGTFMVGHVVVRAPDVASAFRLVTALWRVPA